ncbi:MAG TPA: amidohydrolase family protein [Steroidobacteraceae bacterium]|nr:amidohydrolase family protein [Steroidobacteraceae bacterium]
MNTSAYYTHDAAAARAPGPISEPVIEARLPIIDAHHHLWLIPEAILAAMRESATLAPVLRGKARYLLEDFLADAQAAHNVRATVFAECHAMYRAHGPEEYRSLGEVEFANGAAAMSASGIFGEVQVCAGIIGHVDLRLGDRVQQVLESHVQAGGGRYRGVRNVTHHDADPDVLGSWGGYGAHALLDDGLRRGFKWLGKFELSFDAYVLEPQLPDVIDLARSFPDTQIVVDHAGAPVGVGRYAGKRGERFPIWRDHMRTLSRCDNVAVKLGGLGMPTAGFASFRSDPPATSEQLAAEWKPYVETCIEAFGAGRCMFESNYPVDAGSCSYAVLWNAFKRLAAGASTDEKAALFSGTAARVYRLGLYRDGLTAAYQGELIGEALYRELSRRAADRDQQIKLRAIAEVERATHRRLRPIADRLLIGAAEADCQPIVERRAQQIARLGWPEFIDMALRDWPPYIERFEALRALAPAGDAAAVQWLVDHEVALVKFASVEKDAMGSDASLQVLQAFLQACEARQA